MANSMTRDTEGTGPVWIIQMGGAHYGMSSFTVYSIKKMKNIIHF